jgi:hypothetical protein
MEGKEGKEEWEKVLAQIKQTPISYKYLVHFLE